jgi:hypothetical protein
MADERRVVLGPAELRTGLTMDPPVHDDRVPGLSHLTEVAFHGEGTLAPLRPISGRVLRRLERTRCPPPPEHVPPEWLLTLLRGSWDTRTLLLALRERIEARDPETTFEMVLSITRSLGGASTDGHVLREVLTAESLRTLRRQRGERDAG